MLRHLWFRVINVAVYPANGVTFAVAIVTATVTSTVTAYLVGAAAGCGYEFACRRAGRRLAWPFDTPGARRFAEVQAELAQLRANRDRRRDELEQARAEGRRLDALLELARSGRCDAYELVRLNVAVEEVRRDGDRFEVVIDGGHSGHIDLIAEGERHRMVFDDSIDLTPTGDPDLDPKRLRLAAERAQLERYRYVLPDSAEAALFLDDLSERGGSLWIRAAAGSTPRVELADVDGRRRFGIDAA